MIIMTTGLLISNWSLSISTSNLAHSFCRLNKTCHNFSQPNFFFSFQGAKQVYLPTWFKDNRCFPVQLEEVDKLWDSEWKRCLYNYPHNSQSLPLSTKHTHTLSLSQKLSYHFFSFFLSFYLTQPYWHNNNIPGFVMLFKKYACYFSWKEWT